MKIKKLLIIVFSIFLMISLVGCGTEDNNLKENVEERLSTLLLEMSSVESYELDSNLTTLTLYVGDGFFAGSTFSEKVKLLNLLDQALTKTIQVEDLNYPVDNIQIYIKETGTLETIAHYDNGLVDIK